MPLLELNYASVWHIVRTENCSNSLPNKCQTPRMIVGYGDWAGVSAPWGKSSQYGYKRHLAQTRALSAVV